MLQYAPSPTGTAFLASRKFSKLIMGPVGGGKSTVALFDLLARSFGQAPFGGERRTKHIILRNTVAQLKSTIKPLIDQWLVTLPTLTTGKPMGTWRLTDNVFHIRGRLPDGTVVDSEFWLLAADTPDDVRRLLSLEASAAWVEEAREIDPEVFQGLQGRVARFPNRASGGVTYPGVIGSTNPPPMGSWWQEIIANPPENMDVFIQPPALLDDGALNPAAENLENLDPEYYKNLIGGKTEDWIKVYLKNKFGAGGFGEPVFKQTFRSDFHVSKEKLQPVLVSTNKFIVGMDNGLTAAAVIGQMDARGRVNCLAEAYVPQGESMGVETFLDRILLPKLQQVLPLRPENFLFVLDPACFQRSQINEVTIAQCIVARGFQCVRAPTNDPERRIASVEGLLTRAIDGGPGLLISGPECPWLAQAMDYGYRNQKMKSTGEVKAVAEKNHYSHIADALQYLGLYFNNAVNPAAGRYGAQKREVKKVAYRYA